jgi:CheY-like chemotaxis protein
MWEAAVPRVVRHGPASPSVARASAHHWSSKGGPIELGLRDLGVTIFPAKPVLNETEQTGSPQREGSSVVVKVLYIEDNDDDVYMLKMRLELLGNFEVLTAADGQKGCEVAAAQQPDIILMDLEMPVVDGWEAVRRLKGNSQTQDIPIIALTAHALAGEREKAIATGCEEFDTKPIEFDRLAAILRRILANRK